MAKSRLSDLNKQLAQSEKSETPTSTKQAKEVRANIPRGERSNFLKMTITLPVELLGAVRAIGLKRKAEGKKDTDTSSLIREALSSFISVN